MLHILISHDDGVVNMANDMQYAKAVDEMLSDKHGFQTFTHFLTKAIENDLSFSTNKVSQSFKEYE